MRQSTFLAICEARDRGLVGMHKRLLVLLSLNIGGATCEEIRAAFGRYPRSSMKFLKSIGLVERRYGKFAIPLKIIHPFTETPEEVVPSVARLWPGEVAGAVSKED